MAVTGSRNDHLLAETVKGAREERPYERLITVVGVNDGSLEPHIVKFLLERLLLR